MRRGRPRKATEMKKAERKDTIFVGNAPELAGLYGKLKRPERVLGAFGAPDGPLTESLDCLGDVDDVPGYLCDNPCVRRVYCCTGQIEAAQVQAVLSACKMRAVKFCAVLPVVNELEDDFVPMHVGRQLLLTPRSEPLSRVYNMILKRFLDTLAALLLLLTVFPVVYLVKYFIIRLTRKGPVLQMQPCAGPDGKVFSRIFFQGNSGMWSGMPQLLNVLVGRMSLVGPAPVPAGDKDAQPDYARLERSYMKSGMTGWSQLKRSVGRDSLRTDIWYAEHWSVWRDLLIISRSLF